MKSIKKFNGVFAILFVLLMLNANNTRAQNCYKFFNNTSCILDFDYELFNTSCTSCVVMPNQQVNPNLRFDIPCLSCSPTCDAGLTITGVNGSPITAAQLLLSGSGTVNIPATGGCPAFVLSVNASNSFEAN